MKRIDWKKLLVTSLIFLIPLAFAVCYYGQLPAVLYTHFGIDNQANGINSKWETLVLTPVLAFIFHVCLCIALDVTKNSQIPAVRVLKWLMPILTTLVTGFILLYNLGYQVDIRRLVVAFLAGVYLITGNYMPKDVAGITSPQTLTDRKKAAYLFIGGALALLISLFFAPVVSLIVGLIFILLFGIWSIRVWVKGYKITGK
ncbi:MULTISPECIES: DUF1648 domain-containing protein [unclassified Streptococcus]|uniref:DUF1648 domain-containing protein n=1 Tax=unclassified Streptococcus TaxID=2608887 RepID=UPI0010720B43|nr:MULTISPECIES: DUF1648 domain-containing protein [unclassified Streptococcus]MBF0786763.1 DUF1648 domain-containing protein [Streptococcus sp. 19428wC2_LYSM12]MCQ9211000.1 DUF1648 domain-containing protein [Streptococcus sp. B01]MCQ9214273.1 DUF1648 domain-containing protein [Streptococcus sp. O1]TFV06305.1 DUF1648 domain-containing protein [Streptococcus sp. LYSM12]